MSLSSHCCLLLSCTRPWPFHSRCAPRTVPIHIAFLPILHPLSKFDDSRRGSAQDFRQGVAVSPKWDVSPALVSDTSISSLHTPPTQQNLTLKCLRYSDEIVLSSDARKLEVVSSSCSITEGRIRHRVRHKEALGKGLRMTADHPLSRDWFLSSKTILLRKRISSRLSPSFPTLGCSPSPSPVALFL